MFISGEAGGVVEDFLSFLDSKSQEHWSGNLKCVFCENPKMDHKSKVSTLEEDSLDQI